MRLLDQVVGKFGDQPGLRLDRVDLLIALNEKQPDEEKLKQELVKLSEPLPDWNDNQKADLWNGMAGRYLALKMQPEATAALERVAKLRPDELPTRVALFSLALEANDDAAMSDRAGQDSESRRQQERQHLAVYRSAPSVVAVSPRTRTVRSGIARRDSRP